LVCVLVIDVNNMDYKGHMIMGRDK